MRPFFGRFVTTFVVLLVALVPSMAAQEQVHVSLSGDHLAIQWVQDELPPLDVQWNGVSYSGELAGTTMSAGDTSVVRTYAARVGPVEPGQTVDYAVGSFQGSVRVPPAGPLRVAAYGDIGYDGLRPDGSYESTSAPGLVQEAILAAQPDLVLPLGDLPYDMSNDGWNTFGRFTEPLYSSIVTMPTMGNHEHGNDVDRDEQYRGRWVLPGNELDFSFQAGDATFIAVNSWFACDHGIPQNLQPTEPPCEDGPVHQQRLDFLESALQAAQADDTTWTIVYWHHQTYAYGNRGTEGRNDLLADLWVPLLERYEVDVLLAARDHFYSRTHPITRDVALDPLQGRHDRPVEHMAGGNNSWNGHWDEYTRDAGPIHVISGGGGRAMYDFGRYEVPNWLAHAERTHHATILDISPDALRVQAVAVNGTVEGGDESYTAHGQVLDAFVVWATEPNPASPNGPGDSAQSPGFGVLAVLLALGLLLRRPRYP